MIASVTRSLIISLGIACPTQFLLGKLDSSFVFDFLKSNITSIQIALLAINTATLGIVLTKIRELMDKSGSFDAFTSARREMLLSIREQIALIAASLAILALMSARPPLSNTANEVLQALLISSFTYSIIVLYDTAKSVFILLDYRPSS